MNAIEFLKCALEQDADEHKTYKEFYNWFKAEGAKALPKGDEELSKGYSHYYNMNLSSMTANFIEQRKIPVEGHGLRKIVGMYYDKDKQHFEVQLDDETIIYLNPNVGELKFNTPTKPSMVEEICGLG